MDAQAPVGVGSAQDASGSGRVASLRELRLTQRMHVRLTVIYGIALLLVLTPAAILVHHLAVKAELDGLMARIHATTVGLAGLVDGDRVVAIDRADAPYRLELERRFYDIIRLEPEISSIYVFRPTERDTWMRFVVDTDVRRTPGRFGELYDATRYPELRASLAGPAVEERPVADAWGLSISGFAPVFDGAGKAIAILGIDTDAARIDRMRERLFWGAVATYFGAIALLVLAAIGVGRVLRGPLDRVIRGTEAIAQGRFDTRVALDRADEFGVLGHHFDEMASGLEEREHIRDTFGRYMSKDVARKLLADRGKVVVAGEERLVTVLFSDLRGYSTLSEDLPPAEVLALMNEYLEAMNPTITDHLGCVIEYLGDGILAVFGAPEDVSDHAEHAVRCALAMRERLVALNARWDASGVSAAWKARDIDRLSARVGIHTGRVVAGSLGSRERMKYAILGDSVNLAARLEALNSALGTDILVSEDVVAALPPELASRLTPHGEQMVKGRAQPVRVFSI